MSPSQSPSLEHCPGPVMARLHAVDPGLYKDLIYTAVPGAVHPRVSIGMGGYIELKEIRRFAERLAAEGVTKLVFLGFSYAFQDSLKAGLLDAFDILALYTDTPPPDFLGFSKPGIELRPLAEFALEPGVKVLVADTKLYDAYPEYEKFPCRDFEKTRKVFSAELRATYPELFTTARANAGKAIEAVFKDSKTVLFAGVYAYFNFNKYSVALRKRGWRTVYLCLNSTNAGFRGDHFDAVVHASGDVELFYELMGRYAWQCVYFQAWLGLNTFAAAASVLFPGKVVVESNDIARFFLDEQSYDDAFDPGAYALEERSTDTFIKNSKALVFNLAEGTAEELFGRAKPAGPVCYFHSYPCAEFFATPSLTYGDQPIKLVFGGSLPASNLPDSVFGDVKLFRLINMLTDQGLEFNLLLNPFQEPFPKGPLFDYFHLDKRNPRFHLQPGVEPGRMPQAIAGMAHYGSMLFLFPEHFEVKRPHFARIVPTKLFSYVEAGLPVLVNSEFATVADIVREHGLGVVVGQDEFPRLAEILRDVDYEKLKANVAAYREAFRMDKLIHQIEALLQ